MSCGGCDEGWNGIPLRADLHRLFDAGAVTIEPISWKFIVSGPARKEYGQYDGLDLSLVIANINGIKDLARALHKRKTLSI